MSSKKTFSLCVALALSVSAANIFAAPSYAGDAVSNADIYDANRGVVKQLRDDIVTARESIKKEMAAIQANKRELGAARKCGDTAKVDSINQDIARRNTLIQTLKKEIADKKAQVQGLTHSRQKLPSMRHRDNK